MLQLTGEEVEEEEDDEDDEGDIDGDAIDENEGINNSNYYKNTRGIGGTLLTGSADGTVKRWRLGESGVLSSSTSSSPSSSWCLVGNYDCQQQSSNIGGLVHVRCMVQLTESRHPLVAVGYSDGVIRIWNLRTGLYRCLVHLPHSEINCFAALKRGPPIIVSDNERGNDGDEKKEENTSRRYDDDDSSSSIMNRTNNQKDERKRSSNINRSETIRIAAGSRKMVKIWSSPQSSQSPQPPQSPPSGEGYLSKHATPLLLSTTASVRTMCELKDGTLVIGDSEGMIEFWCYTTTTTTSNTSKKTNSDGCDGTEEQLRSLGIERPATAAASMVGMRSVHKMKAHVGWVNCVVELVDGETLVSGSADDKIKMWDLATKTCKRVLRHEDLNYISSIVQLFSNGLLITGSLDDLIFAWNEKGDLVGTYPASGPVSSVIMLRDGSIAYVQNSTEVEIRKTWNR